MKQYEDLQATFLYCNRCGGSMPVREKLLLILPDGYLFAQRYSNISVRIVEG